MVGLAASSPSAGQAALTLDRFIAVVGTRDERLEMLALTHSGFAYSRYGREPLWPNMGRPGGIVEIAGRLGTAFDSGF